VATAPLAEIAERLSDVLNPVIGHQALIIFTEDCTGRPQKKAGDPAITDHATIDELDAVRRGPLEAGRPGTAAIAHAERPVRVWRAPTEAILVLVGPDWADGAPPEGADGPPEGADGAMPDAETAAFVETVWELAAVRIREQVTAASPGYLVESRAASSERVRVTAELTERHVADLENVLSVLRSSHTDDQRARVIATESASSALVRARAAGDLVISLAEEPVVRAFERLRDDLRPLTGFGELDVQFVGPPVDGRALPGEVAHAARAIARSAILAMRDHDAARRVRVKWDCDGTNLLVDIRDDGKGTVQDDTAEIKQLALRVRALDGVFTITPVPGWGSELHVRLPLDPPDALDQVSGLWDLAGREAEVLRLLAAGQRNRQIADQLGISENTVKFHIAALYRKLGVSNRAAATALAFEAGLR
jgi:DNA-binding CsgD family transcriptional regulator